MEKKVIVIDILKFDNFVSIDFYDNGLGVPDNIKEKIFEPYFTTKHQSRGTGLGLYMSYEIITKHLAGSMIVENKNFEYENEQYYGACFQVRLPL